MATLLYSFLPLLVLLFFSNFSKSFSTDEAIKTFIFRVDSQSKPSIFPTHYHWYTSEFAEPTRILHTFDTVFHGFSACLTETHAASLSNHPLVLAVFENRHRQLHTTCSSQFLGLRNQHGLWSNSDYARFVAKNSNRKLIGARFFSKVHEATVGPGGPIDGINETVEFMSPKDANGQGTCTASTAAGKHAFRSSMGGYAAGIAKGVAPKARLAVYKVCWKSSGCFDFDILAAFDAAVNDVVDVISISVGGGDGISTTYHLDPIAIGAYGAVSPEVFVSSSTGNDGPNLMSVTNLAHWLVTVRAGTIDRNFSADVILSDGRRLNSMYPLVYLEKSKVLSASLCMENSLDPNVVKGKIIIYDRKSNPMVAKGMVVKEAGGMILANGASNGEGLVDNAYLLPTCSLGSDEGDAMKSYVSSSPNPTATIDVKGTVIGIKPALVVASFSARGPNGLNLEILKPDLIAPGVNILADWTDVFGPTDLDSNQRKTEFNILSRTSMACSRVSGATTLLKSAHPNWSPTANRSTIMTTATTKKPSTPYDFGAGHLNLDRAIDLKLIYDITNHDYEIVTRSPAVCPMKKPLPENLNYPSIVALFSTTLSGRTSKTFMRTVTNVGQANVVYITKIGALKGVTVTVNPMKLVFTPMVKKTSFFVTITVDSKHLVLDDAEVVFRSLTRTDGNNKHVVRSPILVTQLDPL
ncbi:hypothetical protein ES319_A01G176800v1 [Gossypium barbadense]|uniref:Subtilisin-like protease fibronectin type-III domain-containing protein n=1 Tax=Gossypium barbadense TaxID=3634 RepID=A0A5J5WXS1_GOSBA|nr:hypothetical protein ES319_A01G176800v1 [Gossypium barbadense]